MKKTILALAIAIAAMGAAATASASCYSEGVRVGEVQKFSQKGFITKSWEGELVQAGNRARQAGQGAAAINYWRFSVTSAAVAKQIDDAIFAGGQVALRYCQQFPLTRIGTTDTPYIVTAAAPRKE